MDYKIAVIAVAKTRYPSLLVPAAKRPDATSLGAQKVGLITPLIITSISANALLHLIFLNVIIATLFIRHSMLSANRSFSKPIYVPPRFFTRSYIKYIKK